MADELRYHFGSMQAGSDAMRQCINKLQSEWDQLRAAANRTLPTWEGKFQQAYLQQQATADEMAREINALLASHANVVDNTAALANQVDTRFANDLTGVSFR